MSKLYEPCPVCKGNGKIPPETRLCVDPPELAARMLAGACPSCKGSGFAETGLTTGQVDRLRAELAASREREARLEAGRDLCRRRWTHWLAEAIENGGNSRSRDHAIALAEGEVSASLKIFAAALDSAPEKGASQR